VNEICVTNQKARVVFYVLLSSKVLLAFLIRYQEVLVTAGSRKLGGVSRDQSTGQ
jgi:hypothetical protein